MLGSDDDDDDDGVDANVQWDDEEGDEEEEEEEEEPCLCLTCESKLPSVHAALEHMHRSHAVDLVKLCHDLKLDDYGTMRLVNYLRADASRVTTMAQERDLRKRLLEDDSLLKPVLESDPLLYGMHRDGARVLTPLQELEEIVAEAATTMPSATNATLVANPVEDLLKAVATVDNAAVQQLLALYKDTSAQLAETQARLSAVERSFRNYSEMSEAALHPDVAAVVADASSFDAAAVLPTQQQPQLDYYFSSYSHYGIHEEMLKDEVRTNAYGNFIQGHADLFKDKVVLDVGCGTGILSMFAAKAGARKVYGVDASNIIVQAQANVVENGLDGTVTLLRGKLEELVLPEKVDIIVSEWMGYFLLYESMLDTVLVARDKWLKPNGRVFPVLCEMKIAGLDNVVWTKERLEFWDSVYGFKMSAMKPLLYEEASVEHVHANLVSTSVCTFRAIDAEKVTLAELEFSSPFSLTAQTKHTLNAFIVYFDVDFDPATASTNPAQFTTGPLGEYTHWKQSVLYLTKPVDLAANDVIQGSLVVKRSKDNARALIVDLTYTKQGSEESFQQAFLVS